MDQLVVRTLHQHEGSQDAAIREADKHREESALMNVLLSSFREILVDQARVETHDNDPTWFKGVEYQYQTKSDFMR